MPPPALHTRLARQARLLAPFVGRELREQFAGSHLGRAWTLLQPALLVLLYWWVFDRVLRLRLPQTEGGDGAPFVVYLLAGLIPWLAFSEGVVRAASALVAHREVVTNTDFPFHLFPLAALVAVHLTHALVFLAFLSIWALWGHGMAWPQALGCLGLFSLQVGLAAGLGLGLAAFSVFFRDLLHLLPLTMQVLLYSAPVLYPVSLVPEGVRAWLWLNPFTALAEGYHGLVLGQALPLPLFPILAALALAALAAGAWLFRRLRPGFADVL